MSFSAKKGACRKIASSSRKSRVIAGNQGALGVLEAFCLAWILPTCVPLCNDIERGVSFKRPCGVRPCGVTWWFSLIRLFSLKFWRLFSLWFWETRVICCPSSGNLHAAFSCFSSWLSATFSTAEMLRPSASRYGIFRIEIDQWNCKIPNLWNN